MSNRNVKPPTSVLTAQLLEAKSEFQEFVDKLPSYGETELDALKTDHRTLKTRWERYENLYYKLLDSLTQQGAASESCEHEREFLSLHRVSREKSKDFKERLREFNVSVASSSISGITEGKNKKKRT